MTIVAFGLFLAALGGLLWQARRREEAAPGPIWTAGWVLLLASAIPGLATPGENPLPLLTHAAGALLPVALLAGAYAYGGRRVPAWLVAAGAALALVRVVLAARGNDAIGHTLALLLEPGFCVAAAWVVFAHPRVSPVQRLLPVTFLGVAAMEGLTSVLGMRGNPLTPGLLVGWLLVGASALAVQIRAAADLSAQRRERDRRAREQAEAELAQSHRRYQALAENAFDLIFETDGHGRVVYANRSSQALLAGEGAEGVGRSLFDWIHPEDRAGFQRWYDGLLEAGSASPHVVRWRSRAGGWRWIESAGQTFPNPSGEPHAVLCSRDVTEREKARRMLDRDRDELERRVEERTSELGAVVAKLEHEISARLAAERKLRTSEERYRLVSELSSDLSFSYRVDTDGSLVGEWSTRAFQRITGYEAEEANRLGWEVLMHPEDWPRTREHLYAAAAGEERAFESRIVTKQGEIRWLRWRMVGVVSPSDGAFRVVGAVRDVTERKQREAERRRFELHMQATQRLESLGTLAGGIAHDFNNLLNVILGNAHLAAEDLDRTSPAAPRLDRIRSAARYAADLTQQILAYAGRASRTLGGVDLSRVVAELLDLLRASVSKKCEIEPDLAADLPLLRADLSQIRQVVMNLVLNAAEALEGRGGTVRVRTRAVRLGAAEVARAPAPAGAKPGRYVELQVSDTGVGIPAAEHDRIFEPYYSTKFSGRGLGLASVAGIVRQHGGWIELESEPGRGATFRVRFPAAPVDVAAVTDATGLRGREATPPTSGTLLVVDDEPSVRELTSELLERAGFRVRQAGSGRAAIEQVTRDPARFDAVVLDLTMPDLDGSETLASLRQVRPDLPVVLMSGYNEEAGGHHPAASRATGFLRKPFEPEDLVGAVRAALGA